MFMLRINVYFHAYKLNATVYVSFTVQWTFCWSRTSLESETIGCAVVVKREFQLQHKNEGHKNTVYLGEYHSVGSYTTTGSQLTAAPCVEQAGTGLLSSGIFYTLKEPTQATLLWLGWNRNLEASQSLQAVSATAVPMCQSSPTVWLVA